MSQPWLGGRARPKRPPMPQTALSRPPISTPARSTDGIWPKCWCAGRWWRLARSRRAGIDGRRRVLPGRRLLPSDLAHAPRRANEPHLADGVAGHLRDPLRLRPPPPLVVASAGARSPAARCVSRTKRGELRMSFGREAGSDSRVSTAPAVTLAITPIRPPPSRCRGPRVGRSSAAGCDLIDGPDGVDPVDDLARPERPLHPFDGSPSWSWSWELSPKGQARSKRIPGALVFPPRLGLPPPTYDKHALPSSGGLRPYSYSVSRLNGTEASTRLRQ